MSDFVYNETIINHAPSKECFDPQSVVFVFDKGISPIAMSLEMLLSKTKRERSVDIINFESSEDEAEREAQILIGADKKGIPSRLLIDGFTVSFESLSSSTEMLSIN